MTLIPIARSPDATAEETRRARILDGATQVFLAYGFQRTTMDDIARAAEISRPALYLLFRNKTDIYRALAREFLASTLANAREAMAAADPLGERLGRAIQCTHELMQRVEESPHGAEMLDMRNSLAADIVADGRAEFHALISKAIAAEAEAHSVDLSGLGPSAGLLADLLLDALDGLKLRGASAGEQQAATCAYIALVAKAVRG